jgi:hypothetical protein
MSIRTRSLTLLGVLIALATPEGASAHGRSRAVALDYTLRIDRVPSGVHAEVIDGDRAIALRVGPAKRVIVRGALDEPMLRFDRDGVWVNRASPTASADRIVRPGTGWTLLTHGHSLRWHDHRLAPPPGRSRMLIALTVDGRRGSLTGTFTRVARPRLWPWLLAAVVLVVVLARVRSARAAAFVAALGALTAAAAFGAWLETGLAAAAVLAVLWSRGRGVAAGVAGAITVAIALGWLGVFRHGVVVSTLPDWLARLAVGSAFVAGAVAVVLGVLEPRTEQVRAMGRDERADL